MGERDEDSGKMEGKDDLGDIDVDGDNITMDIKYSDSIILNLLHNTSTQPKFIFVECFHSLRFKYKNHSLSKICYISIFRLRS